MKTTIAILGSVLLGIGQANAQELESCYSWDGSSKNASLCLNDDGTFSREWGAGVEAAKQSGFYEMDGDKLYMCVTHTEHYYKNELTTEASAVALSALGLEERRSTAIDIITEEGIDPDSYTYYLKEGYLYYKRHARFPHYRAGDKVYNWQGLKSYTDLSNEAATMMMLGRYL
jgi:hypothetical protein